MEPNEVETIPIVQFKRRGGGNNSARRVKKAESDEEDTTVIVQSANTKLANVNSYSSAQSNLNASQVTTIYESKREIVPQNYAGDATATIEVDTSRDRDSIAILEKHKDANKLMATTKTNSFGPARAPAFLRATSRFDYQPDICKDYKETGFCGYGDNCKFLHDRGDYKSGWQMEVEWDKKQNERKRKLQTIEDDALRAMEGASSSSNKADKGPKGEDDEDDDDPNRFGPPGEENYEVEAEAEFPFACHLCRDSFTDPVMTLCGHYFCSTCAHARNKSNTRCAVCDKQTFGVFNVARKLIKHIKSLSGGAEDTKVVLCGVSAVSVKKKGSWGDVSDE